MGTPSREIVAAGYKALSMGLVWSLLESRG
jgi:hypothetical protein